MKPTIGILGGGQLGKMLYLAGANRGHEIHIMDAPAVSPASLVCPDYIQGDFMSADDIVSFGSYKEVVTIEIEKINVDGLKTLEQKGVKVFPQPHIIEMIQDKGLQKDFYQKNEWPSSRYKAYDSIDDLKKDINAGEWSYPFIQKIRKGGYDGRGVILVKSEAQLDEAFQTDFIVEEMIDIEKELAVVTCQDQEGKVICYDPVEMVFDPEDNILLYQLGPADVSDDIATEAMSIAAKISKELGIVGLLAVELFLTKDGQVLINEIAPRPHNSGHHSIEACISSQYDNHLRAISGLAIGGTTTRSASIMYNMLGEPGHTGPVHYKGLSEVLAIDGVYVHIYGKEVTKPARKMGHITIIDDSLAALKKKYETVSQTIKVITK